MTIFYEEVFLVLKVQVGIQVESYLLSWRAACMADGVEWPTLQNCLGNVYFLVFLNFYFILYVSVYSISPESFFVFKLLLLLFTIEWSV